MARAFKDMIVQEADGKPRLTFRQPGKARLCWRMLPWKCPVQSTGRRRLGCVAANLLLELDDDGVPILKLDGGTY